MPHYCADSFKNTLSSYALVDFVCLAVLSHLHTQQPHCAFTLGGTPEASQMNKLTIDQCPRWDSCSANYCPADGGNMHLRDEATCYYMREALRGTPKDLFTGQYEGEVYEAANDHIALWDDLPSALQRDLKKATKSPSRRG
jgi:hypothetical protein